MLGPLMLAVGGPEGHGAALPDDVVTVVDVQDPPLSKEALELLQIERYKYLVEKLWPDQKFEISNGANPPDFLIHRNGENVGVDMVALFNTARKQASSEFWNLKERLRAAYKNGRLRQCNGLKMAISFKTDKFPPPRTIENAIYELIDAFEKLQIGEECIQHLNSPVPSFSAPWPFPLNQSGVTSCGTIQWRVEGTAPYISGGAHSSLLRDCGFELKHDFGEWLLPSQLEELLNRVIRSHDKCRSRISTN